MLTLSSYQGDTNKNQWDSTQLQCDWRTFRTLLTISAGMVVERKVFYFTVAERASSCNHMEVSMETSHTTENGSTIWASYPTSGNIMCFLSQMTENNSAPECSPCLHEEQRLDLSAGNTSPIDFHETCGLHSHRSGRYLNQIKTWLCSSQKFHSSSSTNVLFFPSLSKLFSSAVSWGTPSLIPQDRHNSFSTRSSRLTSSHHRGEAVVGKRVNSSKWTLQQNAWILKNYTNKYVLTF